MHTYTLNDFKLELSHFLKPGLLARLVCFVLPGEQRKLLAEIRASREVEQMVGVIDSMTAAERNRPSILDSRRQARIAKGAGASVENVRAVITQFSMFEKLHRDHGRRGG